MCGIGCQVQKSEEFQDAFHESLHRRGPDAQGEHYVRTPKSGFYIRFRSTVLALRGRDIIKQPLVDSEFGSVLCWNGEAWRLDGHPLRGNDTVQVFNELLNAVRSSENSANRQLVVTSVANVFTRIRGPYAFVFYEANRQMLFFGRDCLGRRSLVRSIGRSGNELTISSICNVTTASPDWQEVEANGIYYLDLSVPADAHSTPHVQTARAYHPTKVAYCHTFPRLNRELAVSLPGEVDASAVQALLRLLHQSLVLRATDIRSHTTATHALGTDQCRPAEVAILFSGGLDCTLLARILDDILPASLTVDLLNVAFDNPRVHRKVDPDYSPYESCPDRITARKAHTELRTLCSRRTWNLVEIDIPYIETMAHRDTVKSLMHPHNTEMDLSIALALYFAARGSGNLRSPNGEQPYSSPARVLVSGLGADELFGGYQRHGTAFARKSFGGLLDELELDFSRLGQRNLGRDDRVMSHWGKEVRFPYLDEDVVAWALAAPVWDKSGFGLDSAVADPEAAQLDPEKRVLRLMARAMGLHGVAMEKKRAIQFGTRSAKMETGNVKGTNVLT